MSEVKTALVLGATGGIGGEMAAKLLARGWQVRALHRNPGEAQKSRPKLQWLQGDAMRPQDVLTAAQGASLIVHAVNPPGYRNWGQLVLPMLESSIAAARATGARIVLPGTIYNFGPDAFPVLTEGSPQNPLTRKGAIRVEMERRLRAAAETGVRTLILRAGDFFGPKAGNNWFAQGLVTPGRKLRRITYPDQQGVGHAWAYLPDVAETIMRLIERKDTASAFEVFHFAGHFDADGTQMVEAIRKAVGQQRLKVRRFPWAVVVAASPFVTLFREMREMRYLWREPLRLDNARLVAALGAEAHTPLDLAVSATLESLGCLPAAGAEAASRHELA
ncbi:Nucleoside-diphosphate-sugar epimerase [Rhizobiales bacterium GAS191]|jgi:nucleoside-diphosphate-sugar epimerase|nr:Nucleoside-diphosphate-sugar epimerase [Rhizobiales bacterium GAS113]SED80812.1 Nucleoside-diphosphate-sugar epimerase [Rhizobiales bacterium GAS191]